LYFFHFVILQSRASYVALVLLVPFIGITCFERNKLLKTLFLCLLIPGLMMLSPIVRDRLAITVNQLTYHLNADDETAWGNKYSAQQDRFYMWNGALRIIRQNPWFGVGTGGYPTVLKAMDNDPDAPLVAHPHNNFLYMAVSFGALGLIVFIWFLYVTIVNGWRHRQTAEGYMLLSVVLVLVASGFFNTQILDVGTALLLSLAIGLQPAFLGGNANG
jgi:O-antigen ligase